MDRRGFLKFIGGGTVGLVASPIIWTTLYDAVYWTQSWSWIPRLKYGESDYIPTVSKLDPTATGIRVRVVDGRPVRVLSDPDNAMSRGGITALASAEAQMLVSEARLKRPLRRTPDGGYVRIGWDSALSILKEKVSGAGNSIAFLNGDASSSLNEIYSAFVGSAGSADYYLMPSDESAADRAWREAGGRGRIGYDFENSDYILALNAPFLESWGTVARNRSIFSRTHPAGEEPSMKLVYAGSVQNNTAAGADEWLPIKPGTETVLALGIARCLWEKGHRMLGAEPLPALLEQYDLSKTAAVTGCPKDRIEGIAEELCAAKAPIVIAGSPLGQGGGAASVMAAITVNGLLGRLGKEGNMRGLPAPAKQLRGAMEYRQLMDADFTAFVGAIADGTKKAPAVLFVNGANPVYALPADSGIQKALDAVPFKVAMAEFFDETAAQCDLILPAAHGLERFDDAYTPYGSGFVNWSLAKPVCTPRYETLPAAEVIIALAEELGRDLGTTDVRDFLAMKGRQFGADFESMAESGEVFVNEDEAGPFSILMFPKLLATAFTAPASGTALAPQSVLGMGTPSTGIPPFATKIITDYQLKDGLSVAQMNKATASSLGVGDGDKIRVSNDNGSIEALVSVFEGVQDGAVALCAGLGHTAFDRFSRGKGANIINLASITREPGTGLPKWGECAVAVARG